MKATRHPITLIREMTYDYSLKFEYDPIIVNKVKRLGAMWMPQNKTWMLKNYGGKKRDYTPALKSIGFEVEDFKPETTTIKCKHCGEEVKIEKGLTEMMIRDHERVCKVLEAELKTLLAKKRNK